MSGCRSTELKHFPRLELLALLMGGGTRGQSVIMTAQTVLARFGNLQNLASASIQELSEINGIGSAKACQIKAAHVPVKSPEEAVESIRSKLKGKKKEHFYLLCLDTRNRVTDADQVS